MNYAWVGAPTDSGFTVSVDVTGPTDTRLVVSLSSDLSSPVYTALQSGADGWHKHTITGLAPDTPYYWALEEGGVVGSAEGPVRTFPTAGEPHWFTFASASCCSTGTSPASYTAATNRNPAFFMHTGDLHYLDITTNNVTTYENGYRTALDGASLQAMVKKVPMTYMWDDHDYGPNNSDSTATGRPAALQAYRNVVPHHPISFTGAENDTPLSLTFVCGRVRFVQLDVRSEAVIGSTPGAGTLIGTTQLNWLVNLIETFTEELLVIDVSVPWIVTGGDVTATDDWGNAAAEREAISNAIQTYAKGRVLLIHGDAHMVAMDDGTNTNFATTPDGNGPRLCCFAPLNRTNSTKGGPYSEGTYTTSTTQYGHVEIEDSGAAGIMVRTVGYTASDTELVRMEFLVGDTVAAPDSDSEKPLKHHWFYAGYWWTIGISTSSWKVYRWAGDDLWEVASAELSVNAATMDIHLDGDKVTWYGWRTSGSEVGRVVYNATTGFWDVDVAGTSVPDLISVGNSFGDGHCVVDSLGRTWGFADADGAIDYFVRDTDLTALLGDTVLTTDPPAAEHLSRSVAWDGKVGVFWDNQTDGRMKFIYRNDADPLTTWQAIELASSGALASNADDHGDITPGPDGDLLAVWKTSLSGASDPNIRYARRNSSGVWVDEATVWDRFGAAGADEHTRPRIVYDDTNDEVYVLASRTYLPGTIEYRKKRRMETTFEATVELDGRQLYDVTVPPHSITYESGLLILSHAGTNQVTTAFTAVGTGRIIYWADTIAEADSLPSGTAVYVKTDGANPTRVRKDGAWWSVLEFRKNGAVFTLGSVSEGMGGSAGTGALTAQQATVAGSGTRTVVSSGALAAQQAALSGTADRTVTGTGALAAQQATMSGTSSPVFTASGVLAAQQAALSGTAGRTVAGTGVLAAQPATIAAAVAATSAVTGVGALGALPATIDVTAGVTIRGSGALTAQQVVLAADGRVFIAAAGALAAGIASLDGAGAVVPAPRVASGALAAQSAALTVQTLRAVRGSGIMTANSADLDVYPWIELHTEDSTWTVQKADWGRDL